MALELTDKNFKSEVLDYEGVALVDFWAAWCGPCLMIAPAIEELAKEYEGKAVIGKMDVESNTQVPLEYGIRSIPTLLIFRNGEVVDKHVGIISKAALAEKLDAQLKQLEV